MQEDEDMSEPFWLQTADGHRRLRRRRQLSSIFLNSGLLLTLLLVIAALLIFLIIPSFLSFTSQILRPHSVKKSWDSLNLLLVLFAILCGFLSRNGVQRSNNGSGSYEPAASAARTAVSTSYYDDHRRFQQSPVAEKISLLSSPQRRFGYERYQDRLSHSAGGRGGGGGGGMSRLRSFNSYPDLRQESLWNGGASSGGDDRWRFYDDTHLRDYSYRFPSSSSDEILPHREVGKEEEMAVAEVKENEMEKEIVVDTLTVAKQEVKDEEVIAAADPPPPLLPVDLPLPAPSSPQLLPPTKVAKRRVQRTYQSVGQSRSSDGGEEREMDIEDFYKRPLPSMSSRSPPQKPVSRRRVKRNINRPEFVESIREEEDRTAVEEIKYVFLPPPSPPPPPPPPPPEKKKKSKDFLISLRRKKKKKQRQNSVENLASLFDPEHDFPATQSESSIPPPSPLPPPPPPPPPPQHFLQNLFSPRRGKSKKVHSVSLAPPPPPPPPPRRAADSTELHLSRNVRRSMEHPSVSRAKSERAPATAYRISNREETGSASPLIPIPPPPPPPPFKMPAWRFEVRGDYVRVASFNSSRSGSPDLESEDPSDRESSPMAGSRESPAAAGSPLFCPSPDVDTKADNFIARFRAGLKLEKVRSNLGPGAGEGPI